MSGLLLSGDIYLDLLDASNKSTGLIGPINTTKFTIKSEAETKSRTSKKKASYGQSLDTVTLPKPVAVDFEFDDQPSELIAALLMGESSALNTGAGSLTDKAITLPANNLWADIGFNNIEATGLVVKDGATPLVLGTDFEVNYAAGLIRALPSGAVAAGKAVTITATYLAVSGTRIKGGVRSQLKARIKLDGTNLTNGKSVKLNIPQASLSPTSEIDFMASEFVSGALGGTIDLVSGATEPFTYDEID